MDRRDALKLLLTASAAAPLLQACRRSSPSPDMDSRSDTAASAPLPSLFIAHGAPMTLEDAQWMEEWRTWAQALPRPRSILMLSAHWEERPATLGATRPLPLIYDFYGFPQHFYRLQYPAPGAPALAARVKELLAGRVPLAEDPQRGLDHGAYVPLLAMYPEADVPVLQLSLPSMQPQELFALGRALAPLRNEGVLVVGSGFLSHNLRMVDWRPNAPVMGWAAEFDAWCAEALGRRDVDALLDYRARAPGVRLALPTHEHFVPVLAALGAAVDAAAPVSFPVTGWLAGSLTKRSVQFG